MLSYLFASSYESLTSKVTLKKYPKFSNFLVVQICRFAFLLCISLHKTPKNLVFDL